MAQQTVDIGENPKQYGVFRRSAVFTDQIAFIQADI
jgi:hypothetical protein